MFPTVRKRRTSSRDVPVPEVGLRVAAWLSPVMLIAATMFLYWSSPTIVNCTYGLNEEEAQPCELPLRISTGDNVDITVGFTLRTNVFSPSTFRIVPDDCLHQLIINGSLVDDLSVPLCDYTKGRTFDFGELLKTGTNRFEAKLHNNGGSAQFLLQPSPMNTAVIIPLVFILLPILYLTWYALRRYALTGWTSRLMLLFVLAVAIRMYYVSTTSHSMRAYDADGHIEYIEYLVDHLSLPAPDAGWEFWQPPLYYTVSAMAYGLSSATGTSRESSLFAVQLLALLFSIWSLWLIVRIGSEMFTDKQGREWMLPLFFSLVAFNPAFVMLSARINNDVLIVPLMMLSLLLLIRWWKNGKPNLWYATMIAIGLSILAKSSGLLLLPVAFTCLTLHRSVTWKRKIRDGTLGLCSVLLIAGGLNIYRTIAHHGEYKVVANTNSLNSALQVDNSLSSFFTFNPVRLVSIPFVSAWDDSTGRNNFWEYVYRTGLFGEFDLGSAQKLTASWIVFWSLLLFVGSVTGFVILVPSWKKWLPLLLVSIILPLAHTVFRFQNPFSPSQDFRHVFLLLIPLAAFAVVTIDRMPTPVLRTISAFSAHIFVALCCMLLLSL